MGGGEGAVGGGEGALKEVVRVLCWGEKGMRVLQGVVRVQGTLVQVPDTGGPAKEQPLPPYNLFTPWSLLPCTATRGSDKMSSSLPTRNSAILAAFTLPPNGAPFRTCTSQLSSSRPPHEAVRLASGSAHL